MDDNEKRSKILEVLKEQGQTNTAEGLTLVFVETKRMADSVCEYLLDNGFRATAIHGDRTQPEREEALRAFRSGEKPIMVATAVAARGLDIPNVTHVISFELPSDIDDYVHRIGRTGRAGNTGLATAFFTRSNRLLAPSMVKLLTDAKQAIPSWLQEIADDVKVNPPPTNTSFGPRRGRGGSGGGFHRRGRGGGGGGFYRRRRDDDDDEDDDIGPRISSVSFR